jgi:hypothetical protein
MATNSKQNIGRDLTAVFTANGQVLAEFGLLEDTHIKPIWQERKVVPTNNGGIPVARTIFGGYDVDVMYARVGAVGDDLATFLENNFVAGNSDVVVTMTETVRNDDGSIDVYQYINGIIYPTDLGSFKGVEDVTQSYKMFFPRRQGVTSSGGGIPTLSGTQIPPN